jgi:hypothetical protein
MEFDMLTLLLQDGFKFFFYANEHEPKHIHVENVNGFVKIELKKLRVVIVLLIAKLVKIFGKLLIFNGTFKGIFNNRYKSTG